MHIKGTNKGELYYTRLTLASWEMSGHVWLQAIFGYRTFTYYIINLVVAKNLHYNLLYL